MNDIQSGIGVVHNTFLLEKTEKTVVRGSFYPSPRSVLHGDFSMLPPALGRAVTELHRAFTAKQAELVVVLGDRLEAMAGALAAYYGRIPLAHLHGGELSDYHLDDATRHAITRLAHLHFPATEESAARLRRMGEEAYRIHAFGAPGLDALRTLEPAAKHTVLKRYGLTADRPFGIFLFHPETTQWEHAGEQARTILATLRKSNLDILALYPNGDPGSERIIKTMEAYMETSGPPLVIRRHLEREQFLQALTVADVLVGNSSCGLIEASFTGTPVLNLGERNRGREHGENVVFAEIETEAINHALDQVLTEAFRSNARQAPCPWGDGTAGARIAGFLADVSLGPALLAKRLSFDD